MLFYKNKEWQLMPLIAKYHQHGEDHEQPVIDESELRAHEKMGHITDLTFWGAEYEQDILSRLDEVKDYPEKDFQIVHDYVLENKVREGGPLDLKKKNESLERTILELSAMLGGEV